MRKPARIVLLAVLLVPSAGCGHSQAAAGASATPMTGEVSVSVVNHFWSDVVLYIRHDGVTERVGMVTAASLKSFVLPLRRFGPDRTCQLGVTQIGGPAQNLTETLVVRANDQITYTLESDLNRSSVMVQ
jgi:hypothetical protein